MPRPAAGWGPVLLVLAFALGLIGIVWTSVILATSDDLERGIQAQQRDNANLTRALQEHTERILKIVDSALLRIAREAGEGRLTPKVMQQVATDSGLPATILLQLTMTDARGLLSVTNRPQPVTPTATPLDLSDREYFAALLDDRDKALQVSPMRDDRITGQKTISLARRISDDKGQFRGIAIASLSPGYFAQVYGQANIGRAGMVALARLDGASVTTVIDGKLPLLPENPHTRLGEVATQAREGQYRTRSPIDGVERLVTFKMLDAAPVVLAVGSPVAAVIGAFEERRNTYYIIAGSFTLMLLFGGAVLLTLWQRQLVSSVRGEARRQLLANVSHEIRTPMNGLLGVSELLLEEPLDTRQHELVSTLHHSAIELLRLVDDILDFSKLDSGRLSTETVVWSPTQAVAECLALVRHVARQKSIRIGSSTAQAVPVSVLGDPHRVRQILLNLCSNAIKFTDSGSVMLHLSAALQGEGRCLLRYDILDTGIGMSTQAMEHAFDPFNQGSPMVTRRYGGTGLGLSISRDLARQMGGDITLSSSAGVGSRFTFTLPVQIAAANPGFAAVDLGATELSILDALAEQGPIMIPPDLVPEKTRTRIGQPRVLIAEDNAVNQKVLSTMLSSLGCEITLVQNGREALESIAHIEFDLVLMDCQMPELDGLSAARAIRRDEIGMPRHLPIIAVTASATTDERDRCLEAGMDDVLTKPYRKATLARVVARQMSSSIRR